MSRDKHRDNDDVRGIVQDRTETSPDTKSEARGDAREAVGNNARDTDARPKGSELNDGTRGRARPDEFDRDLGTENRREPDRDDQITES